MMRAVLPIIVIGIVAFLGYWYYAAYWQKPTNQTVPADVQPIVNTAPGQHEVRIKNFAFLPQKLTVSRGDQVTFVNEDAAPHTVTAAGFGGQHVLNKGERYVLDTAQLPPNTYNYICDFHPSMKGTLLVTE